MAYQNFLKSNDIYKTSEKGLILTPDEYKHLKRAFQGGITHANSFTPGKMVNSVISFDFTSLYDELTELQNGVFEVFEIE